MQKLNGGYTYVTCYKVPFTEISKFDIATTKQPKETLASYYKRQATKPDVMTNGGFFDMSNGLPCFNFIDEGLKMSVCDWLTAGIGTTEDGKIKFGYVNDGTIWKDFIVGYPSLVENGQPVKIGCASEINCYAPRTILGINDEYLFMVVVDGRQKNKPGMTFAQMQNLMIKFGATYAINLDGGGSSRMLYQGSVVTSPTENRPVDNVVALYLKKDNTPAVNPTPAPTTGEDRIYTVKSGDSFWQIAAKEMGNGVRYTTLAAYNGLKTTSTLTVGQKLKIPRAYDIKPTTETTVTNNVSGTGAATPKANYITYIVKSGDSLWALAQKYMGDGSKYPQIVEYNNLPKAAIYKNQVLKIPQ